MIKLLGLVEKVLLVLRLNKAAEFCYYKGIQLRMERKEVRDDLRLRKG